MSVTTGTAIGEMSEFIAGGTPPAGARERAAVAVCDTIGVMLAGAPEAAARIARTVAAAGANGPCRILGTSATAGAGDAALANGVAAHALDFDDMCFVSLAHPSCALVPAAIAAAELTAAGGRALLDGLASALIQDVAAWRAGDPA